MAVLLFILIYGQGLFAQTDHVVEGFRGLKFGTHISEAAFDSNPDPEFILRAKEEDLSVYRLAVEDPNIGTVKLSKILYYFDQFETFQKFVLAGDAKFREDMEGILYMKFGRPDDRILRDWEQIRVWDRDDVLIVFREQRSGDFSVDFRNKRRSELVEEINSKVDDF